MSFGLKRRYQAFLCSTALAATAYSGVILAQEQQEENSGTQSSQVQSFGLEEIIVTANRRRELAQKVPISIQTLNDTQLEKLGIFNTGELSLAVPGFQVVSSAANLLYYLRGVGSQQVGIGISAAVATFVDGVYMPALTTAMQGFNNIESIEVDKGPQGTLFGRNATGGVIQITTRTPEYELSGAASATYANYDHPSGTFYLTGGITDNVAADIALLADRQGDGWGTSLGTGEDVYKRSIYSARSKWLLDLSDATELVFSMDVSRVWGDAGAAISPAKGVQIWDIGTNTQLNIPGFYDTAQDTASNHLTVDYGASMKLTSDLDWARITSITAYRTYHTDMNVDFDGGPTPFLPIINNNRENTFTQELQLSSPEESNFTWTVGAFYLKQQGDTLFQFGAPFATFALPFGIPLGDSYELYADATTTSYSVYGQATVAIMPDTHLTLGGRYTHDRKRISGWGQMSGPVAPAPLVIAPTLGRQKTSFSEPTFRVALDHDITSSVKVYASFNRGFQSGGFNPNNSTGYSAAANPALNPEIIDAYEVGFKSELFDRRLRVNGAAFYYDYKNLQQQIYVNGQLQTLNAGAARIKGIDFEILYQATANLSLGVLGNYLDAEFAEYLNAPGYVYPMGFGMGPLAPVAIPDAKGNNIPFAPKFAGTAYISYDLQTPVGDFLTTVTGIYNDGYYADPGNLYKQPHYVVVNLTEEWVVNDQFSVKLWVKNLFDRKYDQSVAVISGIGFTGNTPGAPREYGLTLKHSF